MSPKASPSISAASNSRKLRSITQQSLKQGTLTFTSAKRTTSTGSLAKGKTTKPSRTASQVSTSASASPVVYISSDSEGLDDIEPGFDFEEEVEEAPAEEAPAEEAVKPRRGKRGEPALKRRKTEEPPRTRAKAVFDSREGEENVEARKAGAKKKTKGKDKLDLKDRDGRWRKHYGVVREKMGHLEPVHGEGKTMIDHILRFFDLSYEYGPCIGVTRLQRWERAEAFGLNPPPEVKEILLTKEGTDNTRYSECVFYGEV